MAPGRSPWPTSAPACKWPYIESIVESWKKQGLYTVADIQAQDKGPAKPAGKPQEQQPNQWAKDAVARMMRAQEE